jgi:hypothetical protein
MEISALNVLIKFVVIMFIILKNLINNSMKKVKTVYIYDNLHEENNEQTNAVHVF